MTTSLSPCTRLSLLSVAVAGIFAPAVSAQTTIVLEDPVVVTATRVAEPLSEAAASISVITAKTIEENVPQTFAETLLDVPNVDVTSSESVMFNRVSIRGSDANQITYLIDGMRQEDTTIGGNQPVGLFIDPEMVKQVEVRRGGGSSLYGNGGIGGTVAVTTKDAADFLAGTDKDWGVKVKTGYASDTENWQKSAFVFGRHGIWDAVVGVNRQDAGETKSSTGKRSENNRDFDQTAVLAKVSAFPNDDMLVSLAYNYDIAHDDWDSSSYGRQTYKNEQHRLTGKWEYEASKLVNIRSAVQYVSSEYAFDTGARESEIKFDSIGANVQNTSEFNILGGHELTFGGDIYKKSQSGKDLEGNQWVDATGRPDSDALDAGLFIQDIYDITGWLSVSPVVRWNYYKRESNKGYASMSDNKVTPGVTVTLKPHTSTEIWASVNTGYRPPILDELYFTMVYPGVIDNAVVVANPDLKPEKSTNWEAGTNFNFKGLLAEDDKLNTKFTFFYDDVKDFIGSTSWRDPNVPGTMYFSTENHGHVVRKGIEVSAGYAIGNFSVRANYGLVHATDKTTDERVPGVTPQSANLRLGYTFPAQALDVWYRARWSKGGKSAEETDYGSGVYKHYASFMTHAVGVEWSPKVEGFVTFTAGAALTNLFDKEYRMLNGSYGYGRAARVWLSAQF